MGGILGRPTLVAMWAVLAGCGGTIRGGADAAVAPDAGPGGAHPGPCEAAGGYCSTGPWCVQVGPQDCGSSEMCCFDSICVPDASMPILASSYDRSCSSDSDCVGVGVGDLCVLCGIGCRNTAINVASKAQYDSDVARGYAATPAGVPYQCETTCFPLHDTCCLDGQCRADSTCPLRFYSVDAGDQ